MQIGKIKLGKKKVMPFTIPSGIIMTEVSALEKIANEIPEIGILTTKSIGPEPREGNREPILGQYMPGGFINAVGLTNPGAEEFAKKLSCADIPSNKFLLASIFGKDVDEFVYVAEVLESYVDGFELNLSCPHCDHVGMALGQDPEIVKEITAAVKKNTDKLIFAKLTPNAGNIGEIAKAAVEAGAYGTTAINTAGPGYYLKDNYSVLTNGVGGLSGIGIKPIGLKCVKQIREAVGDKICIIGMGAIRTAQDVEEYAHAGADIFGIGSALAGMNDENLRVYFMNLIHDLKNNSISVMNVLQEVDMEYKKVWVEEKIDAGCDLKIFKTDKSIKAEPGQFVFVWYPSIGEKPFSVMDDDPLTLGILERGEFTKKFNALEKDDIFYFRGPYGTGIELQGGPVVLVGGGCGIAGLYLIGKKAAERESEIITFLGAKDKEHLPYLEEFEKFGEVNIATEDGSFGEKGMVTDLLEEYKFKKSYFFNCGPKEMIDAAVFIEKGFSDERLIYSSVDYMTRCGVGICGSCADKKGRRTCVEGPFMRAEEC